VTVLKHQSPTPCGVRLLVYVVGEFVPGLIGIKPAIYTGGYFLNTIYGVFLFSDNSASVIV
jgi:hypothetical protein